MLFKRFTLLLLLTGLSQFGLRHCNAGESLTISSSFAKTSLAEHLSDGYQILQDSLDILDIKLVIKHYPPQRSLTLANQGVIDGDFFRVADVAALYKNLVIVPAALEKIDLVAFSTHQGLKLPRGVASLNDYSIGYLLGFKIYEQIARGIKHSYAVTEPHRLFAMLAQGRFDIVIFPRRQGLKIIEQLNYHNIHVVEPRLSQHNLYLLLHKKHQALVKNLAQAIVDVKSELKVQF